MSCRCFPFSQIAWTPGSDPLERKRAVDGAPVVVIEFEPGFRDANVCARGHAGYVLEGELTFELEAEEPVVARSGDAFVIESGTKHRARNAGPIPVRVFVYSW
jgi:quercetin dioxygenase-like cupin family protein